MNLLWYWQHGYILAEKNMKRSFTEIYHSAESITLKYILQNWVVRMWMSLSWIRIRFSCVFWCKLQVYLLLLRLVWLYFSNNSDFVFPYTEIAWMPVGVLKHEQLWVSRRFILRDLRILQLVHILFIIPYHVSNIPLSLLVNNALTLKH
jgi:hypothetical protein